MGLAANGVNLADLFASLEGSPIDLNDILSGQHSREIAAFEEEMRRRRAEGGGPPDLFLTDRWHDVGINDVFTNPPAGFFEPTLEDLIVQQPVTEPVDEGPFTEPSVEELIQQAQDILGDQIIHPDLNGTLFPPDANPFPDEEPPGEPLPDIASPPLLPLPPPGGSNGGGLVDVIGDVVSGNTGGTDVPLPGEHPGDSGGNDIVDVIGNILGSIFGGNGGGSNQNTNTNLITELIRSINLDAAGGNASSNATGGNASTGPINNDLIAEAGSASIGDQIIKDILGDVQGGSSTNTIQDLIGSVTAQAGAGGAGGSANISEGAVQNNINLGSIGDAIGSFGGVLADLPGDILGGLGDVLGGISSDTIINSGLSLGAAELITNFLNRSNKESLDFAREAIDRQEPFRQMGLRGIDDLETAARSTPERHNVLEGQFEVLPTTDVSFNADNLPALTSGTRDVNLPAAGGVNVNEFNPFNPDDPVLQHILGQGTRAIEGSAAARGKLFSGETLEELQEFGQAAALGRAGEVSNIMRGRDATALGADQQRFGQEALLADFTDRLNRNDLSDASGIRSQIFGERGSVAGFDLDQQINNVLNTLRTNEQRSGTLLNANNESLNFDNNQFGKLLPIVDSGRVSAASQGGLQTSQLSTVDSLLGENQKNRFNAGQSILSSIFR